MQKGTENCPDKAKKMQLKLNKMDTPFKQVQTCAVTVSFSLAFDVDYNFSELISNRFNHTSKNVINVLSSLVKLHFNVSGFIIQSNLTVYFRQQGP